MEATPSIRRSMRSQKPKRRHDTPGMPNPHRKMEIQYPRTGKRGAPQVFPRKLREVLTNESSDIVAWNEAGTAFWVKDMEVFTTSILLTYFRHQKYSSFQRQLNLYGFRKIQKGSELGAYAHEYFIRDKPELLRYVRRCSHASLRPSLAPTAAELRQQQKDKKRTSAAATGVAAASAPSAAAKGKVVSRGFTAARDSILNCFSKSRPGLSASSEDEDEGEDDDDEDDSQDDSQDDTTSHNINFSLQRATTLELVEEMEELQFTSKVGAVTAQEIKIEAHPLIASAFHGQPLRAIPSGSSEEGDDVEEARSTSPHIVCNQPGSQEALLLPRAEVTGLSEGVGNLALSSSVTTTNAMFVVHRPSAASVEVVPAGDAAPKNSSPAMLLSAMIPQLTRSGSSMSLGFGPALSWQDGEEGDVISAASPFNRKLHAGDSIAKNRSKTLSIDSLGSPEAAFGSHCRFTSEDWDIGDRSVDLDFSIDKNLFQQVR